MLKTLISAAAIGMLALPAHAALSGFYDSNEQLKTIIESTAVADALGQGAISELERDGEAVDGAIRWNVKSEDCKIEVYLRAATAEVGKTTYAVSGIRPCK